MKVYAVTNDLKLLTFGSVKEFESKHSWISNLFIKCVSSRDLKDVKKGIDSVKSFPLRISASSSNLIKEIKFYKWKEDKDGNVLEEPVKFNDHAVDAMRYAIYNFVKGTQKTSVQRMSVPVARRRKR